MSNVKYLWEIQNLEEKKLIIEKQLKTIPEFKELKVLREEIENSRTETRKLKDELDQARKNLKEEEDEIALLKDKIEKANAELYSGEIINAKELEALEKNINALRQRVSQAEEKALTLMEKLETSDQKVEILSANLEKKKARFRQLNKKFNETKITLFRSLEETAVRKENLSKQIPPEVLRSYYKLCERFDDRKGVALLHKGVCSGCHMSVSFDLRKQAKDKLQVVACDNCSRLLLTEEP